MLSFLCILNALVHNIHALIIVETEIDYAIFFFLSSLGGVVDHSFFFFFWARGGGGVGVVKWELIIELHCIAHPLSYLTNLITSCFL